MIDFAEVKHLENFEEIPPVQVFEIVKAGDWQGEIEKARRTFDAHKAELERMIKEAGTLEVRDQATDQQAVEYGTQAQTLIKTIKSELKRLIETKEIEEVLSFVSQARNIAKNYIDPLEVIKKDMVTKRDRWLAEERRKQAEAEDRARKEAAELQEKLRLEARERAEAEAKERAEKEASEKGVPVETIEVKVEPVPEIIIPDPILPQAQATVRAESGSGTAFQKTEWTYALEEKGEDGIDPFDRVPNEYKLLNDAEIRRQIKLGVRDIPGLRIFEKSKSQFRSR